MARDEWREKKKQIPSLLARDDFLTKSGSRMGRIPPHHPVFSQEWQIRDSWDTELGSVYGRWKVGIPAKLSDGYSLITIGQP